MIGKETNQLLQINWYNNSKYNYILQILCMIKLNITEQTSND